tara:strand:+ start:71 stop:823 length:753 start_codon:yes stop_codon:yes gene_type:complete
MEKSELKNSNPKIYYDLVASGKLTYAEAGALPWGAAVQSPLIESFLGGPHPPEHSSISKPTDFSTPTQLAESGTYPKPWRSAAQKTQNATNSTVGPYAALVGWIEGDSFEEQVKNLCDENNKFDKIKPYKLWGRWGVATSGPQAGNGAFFLQDWYTPSEGTFGADYWNGIIDPPPNPLWQTRDEWWDKIDKVTILTYLENSGIAGVIEVAYNDITFGEDGFYPGPGLGSYPDLSIDMLFVMISLAALSRW